jgi:gluconate 2-dehydrogenase gamma chain
MAGISRRTFIKIAGASATLKTAADVPLADAEVKTATAAPGASQGTAARKAYTFFSARESAIVEAAVARLIPADDSGPGALEADVPGYIDKQLGGAWGAGERLYRSGPWQRGTAQQGYQLPFTPAQLFRNALRAIDDDLRNTRTTTFDKLAPQDQDAYLSALEKDTRELNGVPADVFFDSLLSMTIEGFFCDPVYGGNRDMVSWKMIGFPGAYANYYELVDQHGVAFRREPMSLAEDARGAVHMHPQIPAYDPEPQKSATATRRK